MTVKALPDYSFVRPYVRPRDGRPALIVDIDGTIMQRTERGIHDYHRVSEDVPHASVVRVVKLTFAGMRRWYADQNPVIIFLSGRPERCREDTIVSLQAAGFDGHSLLFMRQDTLPDGKPDYRPDYTVKYELFNKNIRHNYDVIAAYDDRLQVVNLWRALGILCLDVAGGAF